MRLAQTAAPPLMASTNVQSRGSWRFDDRHRSTAAKEVGKCVPASEEGATMSGGERIKLGATVGIVGLLMGAGGSSWP
jgi:hypothetical protein